MDYKFSLHLFQFASCCGLYKISMINFIELSVVKYFKIYYNKKIKQKKTTISK